MSRLSEPAREIVNTVRRFRLNYDMLRKAAHQARKHLGMKPSKGARKLPRLLTEAQLRAFYEAIDKADDTKHQILLRLLFYTAIRVAELCAIKVDDVDVAAGKIFIDDGKGSKDRYVLFPADFRLVLKTYIETRRGEGVYLFESSHKRHYSTGRIRQIVREYAAAAGIKAHPHLLRHQMLSYLTAAGLSDSQIQLISGHSSKKSLERYQHLSLEHVAGDYQEAMRKVGI
jgi:integrase/recombinase XerD